MCHVGALGFAQRVGRIVGAPGCFDEPTWHYAHHRTPAAFRSGSMAAEDGASGNVGQAMLFLLSTRRTGFYVPGNEKMESSVSSGKIFTNRVHVACCDTNSDIPLLHVL